MKELHPAIGQLVVLKRINRPLLEARLEICRPNLAASFHGNRAFPEKNLPTLRAALLLDNDYHFDPDRVQALWPRVGKYTPEEVLAVIKVFAAMPLTAKYRVNVYNIEEISDKGLRREVGSFLAAHIDPAVRLALAENENTPLGLLRLLQKDSEPDVVAAAKDALLNLGEDDE